MLLPQWNQGSTLQNHILSSPNENGLMRERLACREVSYVAYYTLSLLEVGVGRNAYGMICTSLHRSS